MRLRSALCEGKVAHRRFTPKKHNFDYRVCMAWLDLDEVDSLNKLPFWSTGRFNLVQYRRRDFIGNENTGLKDAVYDELINQQVKPRSGKVVLLTHLRSWGFIFNPVSFYFCFDSDAKLYAIVAEITNTPWLQRHAYVMPVEKGTNSSLPVSFNFDKTFHISPFMPMDMQYQWRFFLNDDRISIYMKLYRDGEAVFDAAMGLTKKPLSGYTATKAAFGYPFMCVKVVSAIYWQAFKLWLKRVPFYSNPCQYKTTEDRPESQVPAKASKISPVSTEDATS